MSQNEVLPPDLGLVIDSEGVAVGVFDVDQGRVTEALRLGWGDAYSIPYGSGAYCAPGQDGRVCTGAIPDQLTRELRADLGWRRP